MRDPYQTLGVAPDASPEQIKRAGRKKQKATHPDAGGDRDEFEAVQRALTVLLDPDRREHFDRTGEASEGSQEAQESAEANALLQLVLGNVMSEGDARHTNLPKRTVEHLGAMLREASNEKAEHQRKAKASLDKLEAFRKRLKKKAPGEDSLGQMLDGQIGSVRRSLASATANLERRMRIIDRALAMSQGYEYEVDRAPPPRNQLDNLFYEIPTGRGSRSWFD